MGKLTTDAAAWASGLLAIAAMPLLIWAAGATVLKDLAPWIAIYGAGAAGGLVLELMRSKWRVELPSRRDEQTPDEASDFTPHGPRLDVGFLGRMTTGGIAAPVFLIIYSALIESVTGPELKALAERPDTFAWGVLIGFSSPAAWAAGEGWVKGRLALVQQKLDKAKEDLDAAKKDLDKAERQREAVTSQILAFAGDLSETAAKTAATQNDVVERLSKLSLMNLGVSAPRRPAEVER